MGPSQGSEGAGPLMVRSVPLHVGIIMDGNGRWAQRRGLPRIMGHHAGVRAVERTVRAARDLGIRYVSLYAFSTENWKRPRAEVTGLMGLFRYYIKNKIKALKKEGVRLRFMGRLEDLPEDILEILRHAEEETREGKVIDMIVCLNYGGRQELVDAFNKMRNMDPDQEVTEETVRSCLYLPEVPDPDLIIRTSGELRMSNFLLWQASYSELYFTDTLWPDFGFEPLEEALNSYRGRDRRYGGVSKKS